MQLHSPPNIQLPPLMINKQKDRETLENTPKINNFIKSNLLLDKGFNNLYLNLCKKSQDIEDKIDTLHTEYQIYRKSERLLFNFPISRLRTIPDDKTRQRMRLIRNYLVHSRLKHKKVRKKEQIEFDKLISEMKKEDFKKIITQAKRKSSEIQNQLSKFEQNKKINLDILTTVTFYFCKNCFQILSKDQFRRKTCVCGENVTTISKTRKEPLAYFDKGLRDFIDQNYFLEYGVDFLLRKKGFQTLCGYHVLGHSGNMHEIDNIAESKSSNFRFFCECKTGLVKPSDVFILAGKMTDIGCSRGYILTFSKDLPKEVIHLARSRNISIIEDVLEKSESDLLNEIKED